MTDVYRPPRMTQQVLDGVVDMGAPKHFADLAKLADSLMQMTLNPVTYDDVPGHVLHLARAHPEELGGAVLYLLTALKDFEAAMSSSMEIVTKMDPAVRGQITDWVERLQ